MSNKEETDESERSAEITEAEKREGLPGENFCACSAITKEDGVEA